VILDRIVDSTRKSLPARKARNPLASLRQAVDCQAPPRDFAGALRGQTVRLIAEIKRASPSKGLLSPDLSASSLARVYSRSGAAAISVLTEPVYFRGSFADLEAASAEVRLPVLCKDFIVDTYQVFEARAHRADAVLLIAAILSQHELSSLLEATRSLGMTALVEVHNRDELTGALRLSPRVIGMNNRNLADFSVDLGTTLSLRPLTPSSVVVVSESGIHKRDDVLKLQEALVDAILVGEALVTSPDPGAKIQELLGREANPKPQARNPRQIPSPNCKTQDVHFI
jgi:indole-3-glycerol phosphate synthase